MSCVQHELEYVETKEHYTRVYKCKNCPYGEEFFIECL